jgi:hypothetical protein
MGILRHDAESSYQQGADQMDLMRLFNLAFVLVLAAFWLVPIAAGAWALVTLHRIRIGQDAILVELKAIARSLGGRA